MLRSRRNVTRPQHPAQVWERLERELGRPLERLVVEDMERMGFVKGLLQDSVTAEEWREDWNYFKREYQRLERLVRKAREGQAAGKRKAQARERPDDSTPVYVAKLLALGAQRQREVQAFRSRYLGGTTLPLAEAIALLEGWASAGERTGDTLWVPSLGEGEMPEDFEWVWEFLADEDATSFEERRLPVTKGPLQELKELATRLLRAHPWTEASAVALVMSGLTPGLVVARVRYVGGLLPVAMEVMPWLRAREVAEAYAGFRADTPQLFPRLRLLTDKHRALALFWAQHPGIPWRKLAQMWNEAYPHWRYVRGGTGEVDHRNFARDTRAAWQRLRQRAGASPLSGTRS